jgi:sugar phosphate isomerase/epimerase
VGAECQKQGLKAAYHNHHFEYKEVGGEPGYDILLRSTDPKLVTMEMDCFWTVFAGKDPVAYFEKYPGRFELLHIKDCKKGYKPQAGGKVEGNPFLEVGQGIIDWKRLFTAARAKAGTKQYFVEQDRCDRPPIESIRMSVDYLKKLKA